MLMFIIVLLIVDRFKFALNQERNHQNLLSYETIGLHDSETTPLKSNDVTNGLGLLENGLVFTAEELEKVCEYILLNLTESSNGSNAITKQLSRRIFSNSLQKPYVLSKVLKNNPNFNGRPEGDENLESDETDAAQSVETPIDKRAYSYMGSNDQGNFNRIAARYRSNEQPSGYKLTNSASSHDVDPRSTDRQDVINCYMTKPEKMTCVHNDVTYKVNLPIRNRAIGKIVESIYKNDEENHMYKAGVVSTNQRDHNRRYAPPMRKRRKENSNIQNSNNAEIRSKIEPSFAESKSSNLTNNQALKNDEYFLISGNRKRMSIRNSSMGDYKRRNWLDLLQTNGWTGNDHVQTHQVKVNGRRAASKMAAFRKKLLIKRNHKLSKNFQRTNRQKYAKRQLLTKFVQKIPETIEKTSVMLHKAIDTAHKLLNESDNSGGYRRHSKGLCLHPPGLHSEALCCSSSTCPTTCPTTSKCTTTCPRSTCPTTTKTCPTTTKTCPTTPKTCSSTCSTACTKKPSCSSCPRARLQSSNNSPCSCSKNCPCRQEGGNGNKESSKSSLCLNLLMQTSNVKESEGGSSGKANQSTPSKTSPNQPNQSSNLLHIQQSSILASNTNVPGHPADMPNGSAVSNLTNGGEQLSLFLSTHAKGNADDHKDKKGSFLARLRNKFHIGANSNFTERGGVSLMPDSQVMEGGTKSNQQAQNQWQSQNSLSNENKPSDEANQQNQDVNSGILAGANETNWDSIGSKGDNKPQPLQSVKLSFPSIGLPKNSSSDSPHQLNVPSNMSQPPKDFGPKANPFPSLPLQLHQQWGMSVNRFTTQQDQQQSKQTNLTDLPVGNVQIQMSPPQSSSNDVNPQQQGTDDKNKGGVGIHAAHKNQLSVKGGEIGRNLKLYPPSNSRSESGQKNKLSSKEFDSKLGHNTLHRVARMNWLSPKSRKFVNGRLVRRKNRAKFRR